MTRRVGTNAEGTYGGGQGRITCCLLYEQMHLSLIRRITLENENEKKTSLYDSRV